MKWLQDLLGEPAGSAAAAENPVGVPSAASGFEPPMVNSGNVPPSHAPASASQQSTVVCSEPVAAGTPLAPGSADIPSTESPIDARPASVETSAPINPDLSARLADLAQLQQELKSLFESRIHSDEVQGKSVERLSDELRDYKANFIRQQMLPLLKELIFCYDFVAGEAQRLRSPDAAGNVDPLRSLDMLGQMLMDVLFKYDVEPYRCEGDQFDPKEQQCSRTVPTDIDEQDKKIAGTGATGFRSPAGVIRREQVMVYKFRPAVK